MLNRVVKTSVIVLVFASIFLVGPVTAAINTITTGATVFIGEDGLDVTEQWVGIPESAGGPPGLQPQQVLPIIPFSFQILQISMSLLPILHPTRVNGTRLSSLGNVSGTAFTVVDPRLVLKV